MTNEDAPAEADPPLSRSTEAFFAQVYDELRAIAHARLRGERTGYSLQSTELVHEAYMRMHPRDGGEWTNRRTFFAAAAEAMRRILIERARSKGRTKRGGDADGRPMRRIPLNVAEVAALADDRDPETVLALDAAIVRLAEQDERVAQVVKLRFYAGLTVEEVADAMETSVRTIQRDWAFARSWLYRDLSRQ